MSRRGPEAAALAAVLLVVAWLAHDRAFPGLIGHLRDDGEYAAFARALADGLGYVNPAEPGMPPAARYPIGFPAILAVAMLGAPSGAAQLARLEWFAPLMLVLALAAAYLVLRRLGGFGAPPALAAVAIIGCGPEVLDYGAALHSDTAFAALALATLLLAEAAWRRRDGAWAWAWAGVGLAAGATCLVRYAGVALLAALALGLARGRRWREGVAAAAGFAVAFGPWLLFRARVGGENYVPTIAEMMPAELAEWPARFGLAGLHVLARGVPGYFLPPAVEGGGPWLVVGVAIAALVAWGAWRWWREPEASGFGPLFLGATAALALAVHLGYVHHMPTLPSRYLLPVAPLLWIAAVHGMADVARRSALGAKASRRLAAGGLATGLAAVLLAHVAQPPGVIEARRAAARRHHATFEAVRREVPADARVISQLHVMLWLYTGRQGHSIPPAPVEGRLRALPPIPFLMVLEHWRIDHVVVLPGAALDLAEAVPAFMAAFPGVLEPRWTAEGGAVLRVAPGPFEAACKAHRIRERNAEFERAAP